MIREAVTVPVRMEAATRKIADLSTLVPASRRLRPTRRAGGAIMSSRSSAGANAWTLAVCLLMGRKNVLCKPLGGVQT
jgi:hypothetical protein